DTTSYSDRYVVESYAQNFLMKPSVDENKAWYVKYNQIWSVNTSTNEVAQFNTSLYSGHSGFNRINDLHEFDYQDKRYLVVADADFLSIFNLTDTTSYSTMTAGGVGHIALDLERGRFGMYLNTSSTGGGMKLGYMQLGSGANP